MIIGHGDIASVLTDHPDRLYFAAGVSNSGEARDSEYDREIDLLLRQPRHLRLVYFSSLCTLNTVSRYALHKRYMEALVSAFPRWNIIRLGNITWGNNPHTLINYLRAHPDAPRRPVWRYIVDTDEFLYWINLIPDWNCELSIVGRRMLVEDVYREYVAA